jgi:hypothetical protein
MRSNPAPSMRSGSPASSGRGNSSRSSRG